MYTHCNTEDSIRRQRQIENCMLEMMRRTPYHQITIGDICLKIGLSRKSFYRYFSNKEGCLHSLLDHCILASSKASLAEDSVSGETAFSFERFFSFWKQHAILLEAVCQNNLVTTLLSRTIACIAQHGPEYFHFPTNDQHNDLLERLQFLVCGTIGLIIHWHIDGYKKTAEEMAATVDRLFGNTPLQTP